MPTPINRDIVRHLATLARLELTPEEEARLERDLGNILAYFEELQKVKTDTGEIIDAPGEKLINVFREDGAGENTNQGKGTDAFPDSENGFAKVPAVFE